MNQRAPELVGREFGFKGEVKKPLLFLCQQYFVNFEQKYHKIFHQKSSYFPKTCALLQFIFVLTIALTEFWLYYRGVNRTNLFCWPPCRGRKPSKNERWTFGRRASFYKRVATVRLASKRIFRRRQDPESLGIRPVPSVLESRSNTLGERHE